MCARSCLPLSLLGIAVIASAVLGEQLPKPPRKDQPPRTDRYGDPLPEGASARLGTARFRHGIHVLNMTFSLDGKVLATYGASWICLWEVPSGKLLRELRINGGGGAIAFAPAGDLLAVTGNHDGTVDLLPLDPDLKPRQLALPKRLGNAGPVAFSPDGARLAIGGEKGVYVAPLAGKQPELELVGHKGAVSALAFAPDGKLLASGGDDEALRLWDSETGKELLHLQGSLGRISSVTFGQGGKVLITASGKDRLVRWWDVTSGKQIHQVDTQSPNSVPITIDAEERRLATVERTQSVRLWDIRTGKQTSTVDHILPMVVRFSPDGKLLATASHGGSVRLWETATGKECGPIGGHLTGIRSVAFSADGQTVVTGGDHTIRLWEAATGKETRHVSTDLECSSGVALAPDDKMLAAFIDSRTIVLSDLSTAREQRRFTLKEPAQRPKLAFTADGKHLMAATIKGGVEMWEVATGKTVQQFLPAADSSPGAFSLDGRTLVTQSRDRPIQLWDVASGQATHSVESQKDFRTGIALRPDGRIVATGGRALCLWEVLTGEEISHLKRHKSQIMSVAFSPDGRRLLSASVDRTVRVWEVATGKENRCLQANHIGGAWTATFSPDGRRAATGGSDASVLIWDTSDLPRRDRVPVAELPARQLETLWQDLAGTDAGAAYRAIWKLAESPKSVLPFLEKKLLDKAAPADHSQRIAQLIRALDDDDFKVRESASAELARFGKAAVPALEKALANNPSPEARLRISTLLPKLSGRAHSPERLQALRAIAVLEEIGGEQVLPLLKALADGKGEEPVVAEAKRSLACLRK